MKKLKKKPRVALVLNVAPSYRRALMKRLDESSVVDFFFIAGEYDMQISALMDFKELSGFKRYLTPKFKGLKLIWQKGWYKALFEGYNALILTANGGIRSNWLLLILARIMGKKVYLWGHGLYGAESKLERLKNLTYMRLASGVMLYGNFGKQQLLKNKYKREKISVVFNSLDTDLQKTYRDRKEDHLFIRNYFGSDAPIVIFLGRLTPQKSLHLLIEALGVLKAQGVECNAIMVGSGTEENRLQKRAEEIGVDDNIWFYGDCYDESMIATLFKASSLTVSPGNVGLTAMHSLTYGIPVVTHNFFMKQMPEFEAIKKCVTGDFYYYNDSISLADKIYTWITKMKDPLQKEECQKECKRVIDEVYNPENQASKIEKRILSDFEVIGAKK